MKKVLAILIPAILSAGSAHAAEIYNKDANKLDLYGKVDARHLTSDDKANNGDATYIRLGFKGETQIADSLTGYGQWEYNIQGNKTEEDAADTATRLGFAGLRFGDFGSFDYGRNYGVIYDVVALTDILPVFGGDSFSASDNFMTGRANNLATWRNSNFFGLVDGLNIALQYQGSNRSEGESANGRSSVLAQNDRGWGASLSYDIADSGVTAVAAYAGSSRTQQQRAVELSDAKHAEAWATGVRYDANSLYLAAIYAETRNMTAIKGELEDGLAGSVADKAKSVELVAQYQFDFGLRPSLAYLQSKVQKQGEEYTQVKYIELGSTYYFNKNMAVYADYKFNLLNKNRDQVKSLQLATDDIFGLGMIYQF